MPSARIASKALGMLFATAVLAVAQSVPDQPEVLDLLKNVELTYRAMRTFSAKSTTVMEMNNPNVQQKIETPMTITADSSGRMRMETTSMGGTLTVFDGSTLWIYMSPLNKYMKMASNSAAPSGQPGGGVGMFSPGTNSFLGYRSVASNVRRLRFSEVRSSIPMDRT
jgi:outer membrane lipoprotein-sorting protein